MVLKTLIIDILSYDIHWEYTERDNIYNILSTKTLSVTHNIVIV